jgi:hypothetical protein
MRFWFDTEFIEDGHTIDLISIGVFSEDRRKFYAEVEECDYSRASDWVVANVLPHLHGERTPRTEIAAQLLEFMGEKPEIWAYYADYDWVALCQLFGRMIDLPKGWPMFCRDVKQLADSFGNPQLPGKPLVEHNALSDAIWTAEAWQFLTSFQQDKSRMTNLPDTIESDDGNRWVPTVELRWHRVLLRGFLAEVPQRPRLQQRFCCLSGPREGERVWRDVSSVVSE